MKSLILLAHGSRLARSNAQVRALSEQLAHRVLDRFDDVSCAFLELAEPSLPAMIDAAVLKGSRQILVLPYFLACGAHVSKDVPAVIEAKREQHAAVRIELRPYVGAAPGMIDLLASLI